MPLTAVFAVAALIVGVAIGYWIRSQSVHAQILAEKQSSEKLAAQLADKIQADSDSTVLRLGIR